MNINNNQFLSIDQLKDKYLNNPANKKVQASGNESFQSILDKVNKVSSQGSELKFSKHASARLATRDITLDDSQLGRLEDGVMKAEAKGIKDSLMLMDGFAFIVNVPSGTVITAMDQAESSDSIFTNIDGAVIV